MRIKFLARFVTALIQVRTVNLAEIAGVFAGASQIDSNYKRIQRFLRSFEMPYEEVAAWVVKPIGVTGSWILSMDRTDRKLGKTSINILTLAIVLKGIAFPVMWTVLGKSGCSNTTERKALVGRFKAEATPIADYAHRWGIETLFGCLKSRGFNLEDTHMTQSDRLEKLMVLPTVAFCWSYVVGEWRVSLKALKIKKHGRRARSVFRTGLDILRRTLTNLQNVTQLADFKKVVSLLSCT